jgi:hypothetical protein
MPGGQTAPWAGCWRSHRELAGLRAAGGGTRPAAGDLVAAQPGGLPGERDRAASALAGPFLAKARGATIRRQLIAVAARIARHGRGHITLHLPEGRHCQHGWMNLFDAACRPPEAAA